MVFKNLTAKKLKQDAAAEWSGGTVYEKIPDASDSESQYLDLYVPDAGKMSGEEGGSNKPRLFVLVLSLHFEKPKCLMVSAVYLRNSSVS